VCSPSRAALFTGQLPHRFGEVRNGITIAPGTKNLATELLRADYRLGYVGKWHADQTTLPATYGFEGKGFPGYGYPYPMDPARNDPRGFRSRAPGSTIGPPPVNHYFEYLAENGLEIPVPLRSEFAWDEARAASMRPYQNLISGPPEGSIPFFVGAEAAHTLERFCRRGQTDRRPFFLWVNFWGPHNPCSIPEPYWSMYDRNAIPEPGGAGDSLEGKPLLHERMARYWGTLGAPWSFWQKHLAAYFGYCSAIDDQVGRFLEILTDHGQLDETIVIFAADHGDMLGRHHMLDKGGLGYEDIYRVPLIVRQPGGRKKRSCDDLVMLQDLFPTILEWAGVSVPAGDFSSLNPYLDEESRAEPRRAVFGEFDQQICANRQRLIRTGRYKLVVNATDRCELYDLRADPDELENRYEDGSLRDVRGELTEALIGHMEQTSDRGLTADYLRWGIRP
jgi:arylsulfatase A-like enzyme